MNRKKRLSGIWLMSMALLSLGAFTVFFVAQMWLNILFTVYLLLVLCQFAALNIYMLGPEKLTGRPLQILYKLLYASSFLVIPTFLFIFSGLVSQYHGNIPDSIDASNIPVSKILPEEHTVVYNTGTAYIIFPEYTSIDLVCKDRPKKSDESITWCSGAAFQHAVSIGFTHENIEGDHASGGQLYKSPHHKNAYAAFTFSEGDFSFEFDNEAEAIKDSAAKGGSGFMQFGLIRDRASVMNFDRPRSRCYRALAELNGNICIIDTARMMHFNEFMSELQRLGVTNAVYMDMGAGWNYSWYRNAAGKVVTLFGLPVPWSHNWVVFRK